MSPGLLSHFGVSSSGAALQISRTKLQPDSQSHRLWPTFRRYWWVRSIAWCRDNACHKPSRCRWWRHCLLDIIGGCLACWWVWLRDWPSTWWYRCLWDVYYGCRQVWPVKCCCSDGRSSWQIETWTGVLVFQSCRRNSWCSPCCWPSEACHLCWFSCLLGSTRTLYPWWSARLSMILDPILCGIRCSMRVTRTTDQCSIGFWAGWSQKCQTKRWVYLRICCRWTE